MTSTKKGTVTLLGLWASPFSTKVQMALNLKSIDYEFIEEDILNKSQRLLEANPIHKKIPVLIHEGKPICESLVIVEYIDDVWSGECQLLPSNPYDRATVRFWAAYVDKLYPCLMTISHADGDEAKVTAGLEEANQVLAMLEKTFINCSKGQNFFGVDRIGYLDIALGSYLSWIRVSEKVGRSSLIDGSKTPNLFRWAQHFCGVDAVKDVVPETDELLEFGRAFVARAKASNKS